MREILALSLYLVRYIGDDTCTAFGDDDITIAGGENVLPAHCEGGLVMSDGKTATLSTCGTARCALIMLYGTPNNSRVAVESILSVIPRDAHAWLNVYQGCLCCQHRNLIQHLYSPGKTSVAAEGTKVTLARHPA